MQYRTLGRTGITVSPYALGAMMFATVMGNAPEDSIAIIDKALDAGINFIDTADAYGDSEEIVGRALKGRRDDVVLATKVGRPVDEDRLHRGASRRWIMKAVEGSLRRLRTDHIDLYQIHRPDPDTDIEETLSALTDLVRSGKVRAIGTSGMPASDIVEAQWVAQRRGLERFHTEGGGSLERLRELFEISWRRSGFGESDDELQFRERALESLERYWQLDERSEAEPVWFERSFAFKIGPHLLRGRVDRVDRHPDGSFELIDYKTGKAKTADELREDVQLSGYGTVHSWCRPMHPPPFGFREPPIVAVIQLQEGTRFVSNVVGVKIEDVKQDMEVEVCWEDTMNKHKVPVFRPRSK